MAGIIHKFQTAADLYRSGGMTAIKDKIKQKQNAKKKNMIDGYEFIMNRDKSARATVPKSFTGNGT